MLAGITVRGMTTGAVTSSPVRKIRSTLPIDPALRFASDSRLTDAAWVDLLITVRWWERAFPIYFDMYGITGVSA